MLAINSRLSTALLIALLAITSYVPAQLQCAELKPIKASKFKIKAKPAPGRQISDIKGAHFFTTQNNGESWDQIEAAQVTHKDGEAPYFIFKAQSDGAYGFWIQVHYKDGTSEKAPSVGSRPPTVRLLDITAPRIDRFLAGLIDGTEQKLFLEWAVSDKHLGDDPVQIEISSDQSQWQSSLRNIGFKGNQIIALPTALPFYVRLTTSDSLGNSQHSEALLIKAADTNTTAVANTNTNNSTNSTTGTTDTTNVTNDQANDLPSLKEIEADVNNELAKQDPKTSPEPKIMPRPKVPEGHQEIIAPYANKPWPSEYTNSKKQNEATEAAQMDNKKQRIISEDVALILKRRKGRILFGKDAELILAAARQAVIDGNNDRAQVLYARLTDSTVANEALPEEIELHIDLNQLDVARELVRTAPPEVKSTRMRIQEANLQLAQQKRKAAINILKGIIPDKTDEYKNARLLLARCYIADKKPKSAKNILAPLSENDDSWGQAAQRLLEQIP